MAELKCYQQTGDKHEPCPQEYPAALKVYSLLKIILIPALKGHV